MTTFAKLIIEQVLETKRSLRVTTESGVPILVSNFILQNLGEEETCAVLTLPHDSFDLEVAGTRANNPRNLNWEHARVLVQIPDLRFVAAAYFKLDDPKTGLKDLAIRWFSLQLSDMDFELALALIPDSYELKLTAQWQSETQPSLPAQSN